MFAIAKALKTDEALQLCTSGAITLPMRVITQMQKYWQLPMVTVTQKPVDVPQVEYIDRVVEVPVQVAKTKPAVL